MSTTHVQQTDAAELFWFDFTLCDRRKRGYDADGRAFYEPLYGHETRPLLEGVAGVEFTDDQFRKIIGILGHFIAHQCMRMLPKSHPKSQRQLANFKNVATKVLELENALLELDGGDWESLGWNIWPFNIRHPQNLRQIERLLRVVSRNLQRFHRGVEQSYDAGEGRPRKDPSELVEFCLSIKQILREAGAKFGPVGYRLHGISGEYKGVLGKVIQTILQGESDYTDGQIYQISDAKLVEVLKVIKDY